MGDEFTRGVGGPALESEKLDIFYEAPPGLIKEKEEDRPEDSVPDLPGNEQVREFLAKAPSKGLWCAVLPYEGFGGHPVVTLRLFASIFFLASMLCHIQDAARQVRCPPQQNKALCFALCSFSFCLSLSVPPPRSLWSALLILALVSALGRSSVCNVGDAR